MTGELFVEGVHAVWDSGQIVKVDLYSLRPDAPANHQIVVCRLVASREDLVAIATKILEALGTEHQAVVTDATRAHTALEESDEVLLVRSE